MINELLFYESNTRTLVIFPSVCLLGSPWVYNPKKRQDHNDTSDNSCIAIFHLIKAQIKVS